MHVMLFETLRNVVYVTKAYCNMKIFGISFKGFLKNDIKQFRCFTFSSQLHLGNIFTIIFIWFTMLHMYKYTSSFNWLFDCILSSVITNEFTSNFQNIILHLSNFYIDKIFKMGFFFFNFEQRILLKIA